MHSITYLSVEQCSSTTQFSWPRVRLVAYGISSRSKRPRNYIAAGAGLQSHYVSLPTPENLSCNTLSAWIHHLMSHVVMKTLVQTRYIYSKSTPQRIIGRFSVIKLLLTGYATMRVWKVWESNTFTQQRFRRVWSFSCKGFSFSLHGWQCFISFLS